MTRFLPYGRQCIEDDDIAAVVAVLRRSVRMPKRPYLKPSAEAGWRYFRAELPRRLGA